MADTENKAFNAAWWAGHRQGKADEFKRSEFFRELFAKNAAARGEDNGHE